MKSVCVHVIFLGNITNVTIHYNREHQLITCLSKGGPATTVTWSLNNMTISTDGQKYENSQTIIDTTSALYENRLRIINKISTMAGVYKCMVSNPMGSLSAELDIQGNVQVPPLVLRLPSTHAFCMVCMPEQVLGWFPLGTGYAGEYNLLNFHDMKL